MGDAAEKVRNWATHYAPGMVLLDAEQAPANDGAPPPTTLVVPRYKWVHCCNEGRYEGHHQGAFEMTRAVFDAFVRNFRAHPQFRPGQLELDGGRGTYKGGVEPVLQYDYEHASECPPWEGTIPSSGAPACAWALDCEIRERPDGKASFWVFTELLDELRTQIAARKQRWVSIAFTLEGIHWLTREPLGPMLTSVAITNHPFMLDLEPLAASRRTSQPARGAVRSASDSPEAPGSSREPTRTRTGANMDDKLRERICRALKIQTLADDAAVGGAVEEAVAAGGNLKSLLEALGVKDADGALAVIPELRSAREKMASMLAELDAMLAQDIAADASVANADVAAAMRAGKLSGTGAQEAITVHRKSFIDGEIAKVAATKKNGETVRLSEHRAARELGRKAFLSKYGVAESDKQHLSTTFVASSGGVQVTPPTAGATPLSIEPRDAGDRPVIDLRGVKAANPTLRLVAHLQKNEPGFAKLSHSAQVKRASEYRRTVELQLE